MFLAPFEIRKWQARVLHSEYRYHFKAIDNGFMGHMWASILTQKWNYLTPTITKR
jgi:hypothetical protein